MGFNSGFKGLNCYQKGKRRSLVTSEAVLSRISEEYCTEEFLHMDVDGIALAKETRSSSRKPSDTGTDFLRVR